MEMFDIITIPFKCPYCGMKSHMEFQTKDLENMLKRLKPGDRISNIETDYDFLSVVGSCHSPECQARADKFACTFQQCASGFGALFNAKIRIKDGIITNDIFDIEIDEDYTDEHLNSVKDKWKSYYKPRGQKDHLTELWEGIKIG